MEQNATAEIKAYLMQTNEKFRHLAEQHSTYKKQIQDLEAKHTLTAEEEMEEHRLKKLKLHLKDEMEHMLSEHRPQHAG